MTSALFGRSSGSTSRYVFKDATTGIHGQVCNMNGIVSKPKSANLHNNNNINNNNNIKNNNNHNHNNNHHHHNSNNHNNHNDNNHNNNVLFYVRFISAL